MKNEEAPKIVKPEPPLNIKNGPGVDIPNTFQEQAYVPTHNREVEPPAVLQDWPHAKSDSTWTKPATQSGGWSTTRKK